MCYSESPVPKDYSALNAGIRGFLCSKLHLLQLQKWKGSSWKCCYTGKGKIP